MEYKSLFDIWKYAAEKFKENILFSDNTQNRVVSYKDAFNLVCFLAEIFQNKGIKRFDKVSLFAVNSPDWLILEQAVITLGAICVSKPPDVSMSEFEYAFLNSNSCSLITDNYEIIDYFEKNIPDFYNKVKFVLYTGDKMPSNYKILKFSDILFDFKNASDIDTDFMENSEDTAYINYTSGTSAQSKGAMLSNKGMVYVTEELLKIFNLKAGGLFVSVHSLSSVGWKCFHIACIASGCRIIFTDYKEFWETIKKYKPDYLHIAPKVIQKMQSMFMAEAGSKGYLFTNAYRLQEKILEFERKHFSCFGIIKFIMDKLFFKPVRNTILKDDVLISTGSAHLSKPLEDFFQIMNIKYIFSYGLTETTGVAISNTLKSSKKHPYTVGIPFSKTILKIIDPVTKKEVKQGETGLITMQGPSILQGYYNNEKASKKALPDGKTFITGDLGVIDNDGYLTILSRYDDVIVLSNGYDVYVPLLDNEIKDSEFVVQSVTAGHKKPYLISLIVLNTEQYKNWLSTNSMALDIQPNDNERFKDFLLTELNEKIKRKKDYRYYEKIKKLYFLDEGFLIENGLLTSTLKVKYKSVLNKYNDIIENLYKDEI